MMGQHAEHLHNVLLIQHLIHEPVLDVDTPGEGSRQVADQLLKGRRLIGVMAQEQLNMKDAVTLWESMTVEQKRSLMHRSFKVFCTPSDVSFHVHDLRVMFKLEWKDDYPTPVEATTGVEPV